MGGDSPPTFSLLRCTGGSACSSGDCQGQKGLGGGGGGGGDNSGEMEGGGGGGGEGIREGGRGRERGGGEISSP